MELFQTFIYKIIILSISTQVVGIFVKKTSFKKLYALICGLIFMLIISSAHMPDLKPKSLNNTLPSTNETFTKDILFNNMSESLKKTLEADLDETFMIHDCVEVELDYEKIKITVKNTSSYQNDEIYQYIKNKYCRNEDEVVVYK